MKFGRLGDMGRSVLAGSSDELPSDHAFTKESGRAKRVREHQAKEHKQRIASIPWNDQRLSRKVMTVYKDLAPSSAAMTRTARVGITDERLTHTMHMGGLNTQPSSRRMDMCAQEGRMSEIRPGMSSVVFETTRGAPVRLELPSNPTTGFKWEVVSSSAAGLRHPSRSFQAPSSMRLGAGGKDVFDFSTRRLSRGTHQVNLVYKRSWEAEAVQTFTLFLTIR